MKCFSTATIWIFDLFRFSCFLKCSMFQLFNCSFPIFIFIFFKFSRFIVFVLLKVGSLNVERCPALLRPSLCARPSLPSVVDGLSLFRSVCYQAPLLRAPYGLTTYCFDASLHGYQSSVEAVYLVTGWSLCLGLQL